MKSLRNLISRRANKASENQEANMTDYLQTGQKIKEKKEENSTN